MLQQEKLVSLGSEKSSTRRELCSLNTIMKYQKLEKKFNVSLLQTIFRPVMFLLIDLRS
jgi:hypothetical protein